MTLTPLEASLIAVVGAIVVGIAVHIFMRSRYVTCEVCEAKHRDVDKKFAKLFSIAKVQLTYDPNVPPDVKADLLREDN